MFFCISEARASSFSSEDSTPVTGKQRAASLDMRLLEAGQVSYPPSPRAERKLTPHSLYPRTLTVELPQVYIGLNKAKSSHNSKKVC